jgi:NTP pyrophosphatase (non-canonical NTP hydrolase)
MTDKILEALGILQEECAEVIVEVSKCRRFGIDSEHYTTKELHKDMLAQEIGDVMCMVEILVEQGVVNRADLILARERKREKLKRWSKIFEE